MRTKSCDLCGKEGHTRILGVHYSEVMGRVSSDCKNYDVCDDCADRIRKAKNMAEYNTVREIVNESRKCCPTSGGTTYNISADKVVINNQNQHCGCGDQSGITSPSDPTEEQPYGVGVYTEEELREALADENAEEISLESSIVLKENLQITRPVTIDGCGNKLSSEVVGTVLTVSDDIRIKNLVVEVTDNDETISTGVELESGKHVIKDSVFSGGDCGIVIYGGELTLSGEVNISGNTTCGIKVCTPAEEENSIATILNANDCTIIYVEESTEKPTLITDLTSVINGIDSMASTEVEGFLHYYLDSDNAVISDTEEDDKSWITV